MKEYKIQKVSKRDASHPGLRDGGLSIYASNRLSEHIGYAGALSFDGEWVVFPFDGTPRARLVEICERAMEKLKAVPGTRVVAIEAVGRVEVGDAGQVRSRWRRWESDLPGVYVKWDKGFETPCRLSRLAIED